MEDIPSLPLFDRLISGEIPSAMRGGMKLVAIKMNGVVIGIGVEVYKLDWLSTGVRVDRFDSSVEELVRSTIIGIEDAFQGFLVKNRVNICAYHYVDVVESPN